MDALDLVGHLVDKSLLVPIPSGAAYRYRMLETVRQYAHDRLVDAGERDEADGALLDWVLTAVSDLDRDMRTARQDAAIVAVLPERANANAAIDWAVERGGWSMRSASCPRSPCAPPASGARSCSSCSTEPPSSPTRPGHRCCSPSRTSP